MSSLRLVIIFSLILLFSIDTAMAQSVHLSGTIEEQSSGESIPGATLAILGTSHGAKANVEGRYRLELERGKHYRIRITAIGYKPDTLSIVLLSDSSRIIRLASAPILGATITVSADASRAEARRIMHRVIDTKDAWQSQISDYRFGVYSRLGVRSKKDTSSAVLMVMESVAEGFWKRDKGYAEHITARKETANLPADLNRIALLEIINFYNDRLQFGDYNIVSPVAHDAFDEYDYDLLGEGELNGSPVYKISVEPQGALSPGFTGTLWIDKTDYTIAYLELSPNDAVKFGPIKDITFRQTFSFVDNKYWMPSQMNFGCRLKLELPIVPEFTIDQTATLQDYIINSGIADSIFSEKRHTVAATADSVDSLHWTAMRTIPLARDEDTAYHMFDSLSRIPPAQPSFSPMGLLFELVPGLNIYQFNRVEASHFEFGHTFKLSETWPLSISGYGAYGTGDQRWKYFAGFEQGITWKQNNAFTAEMDASGDVRFGAGHNAPIVTSSVGGNIYDWIDKRGEAYDPTVNTLTALVLHSDYPEYYRAHGFDLYYSYTPSRTMSTTVTFKNEQEQSLPNVTDFSLLLRQNTFRINPQINDGRLHELSLASKAEFSLGHWQSSAGVHIGYSDSTIGSQFSYLTAALDLSLEGKLGGWGKARLSGAYSSLAHGALPRQALFFFESRDAIVAPRSVFRTMSPFEFQGDQTWQAMFEQNFYDLPTRALGIHLPTELHWFGFVNAAGSTVSNASQALSPTIIQTLSGAPYVEAGVGLGNIFNLVRFDASWRLTHRIEHNFYVTGTMAISF